MADFFKYGEIDVNFAGQRKLFCLNCLCNAHEDRRTELVVEETAFNIACFGDSCARIKTDIIARCNAEFSCFVGGKHFFVKHKLHVIVAALLAVVFAVDVNGRVVHLETAFKNLAVTGIDTCIFAFGVVCVHAADAGQLKPSVALDFGYHSAEGVNVCREDNRAAFAAETAEHTALAGKLRLKTELAELLHDVIRSFARESARTVYCHNFLQFIKNIVKHFSSPYVKTSFV